MLPDQNSVNYMFCSKELEANELYTVNCIHHMI